MAWDGNWDATYGTSTSSIVGGMQTYYDLKFLKRALNTLRFAPLGQKRDIPKNKGELWDDPRTKALSVYPDKSGK